MYPACVDYCFSVLTVGSIVLLERVTKWNKLEMIFLKTCISHVYLAHVSCMRVLDACVRPRVVTEIKSQIKIQVSTSPLLNFKSSPHPLYQEK